jgi:hypothetical protein
MSKLPWWLKLFAQILLVDLVVALLVLGWSWITKDFSITSLSNRFFVGGIITILIGVSAGAGSMESRTDWQQVWARSAGPASPAERHQQVIADFAQEHEFVFLMVPAGLIAILIAIVLG